jgi:phenylalanyl-tRNA synthetase beta chain
MRPAILPGLLAAAERNVGRGESDLAIFEAGSVFADQPHSTIIDPGVAGRPDPAIWAAMNAALPRQPEHVGLVLTGNFENPGAWGKARQVVWSDAIGFVHAIARDLGVEIVVAAGHDPIFHPGRCAEISLAHTGESIGFAGELHPQVVDNFHLPKRACAAEIDFDILAGAAPVVTPAPVFSIAPVAKEDLAFVVSDQVSAANLAEVIRHSGGECIESVRLFDVYVGDQVPEGHRSLAFAIRLRHQVNTLSAEDLTAIRNRIIDAVATETGGSLR